MEFYTIDLKGEPEKFYIRLNGIEYLLVIRWNNADDGSWIVDIYNNKNEPLILGIPLVYGCDLLAQYEYVGIKGKLFIFSNITCLIPYYTTLDEFALVYVI